MEARVGVSCSSIKEIATSRALQRNSRVASLETDENVSLRDASLAARRDSLHNTIPRRMIVTSMIIEWAPHRQCLQNNRRRTRSVQSHAFHAPLRQLGTVLAHDRRVRGAIGPCHDLRIAARVTHVGEARFAHLSVRTKRNRQRKTITKWRKNTPRNVALPQLCVPLKKQSPPRPMTQHKSRDVHSHRRQAYPGARVQRAVPHHQCYVRGE